MAILGNRFASDMMRIPVAHSRKRVPNESKKKNLDFYNRENVSWTNPGKTGNKRVVPDGDAKHVQRKYLQFTMQEPYEGFKQEIRLLVGRSLFCDLRQDNIWSVGKFLIKSASAKSMKISLRTLGFMNFSIYLFIVLFLSTDWQISHEAWVVNEKFCRGVTEEFRRGMCGECSSGDNFVKCPLIGDEEHTKKDRRKWVLSTG